MRFSILGDHSDLHAGCQAVIESLKGNLLQHGEIVESGAFYDALIVNGEGSMHHSSPHWAAKMRAIEFAQAQHKKTWLINSVWQDNNSTFDESLKRLEGIALRGPLSARNLAHGHGIEAGFGLDISYFAAIDDAKAKVDYNNEIIVTDFWSKEFNTFLRPSSVFLSEYPYFELNQDDWSGCIAAIKTSRFLITGRHHAMYAACKARVPFLPIGGNCHKFEDLIHAAPCSIPICRNRQEIQNALTWLQQNKDEYNRLFDWMEAQKPWDLMSGPSNEFSKSHITVRGLSLEARASNIKQDGLAAERLWKQAGDLGLPKQQVMDRRRQSYIQAGNIPQAALMISEYRFQNISRFEDVYDLERIVSVSKNWQIHTDQPSWWHELVSTFALLESGQENLFIEACKASVLSRKDPVEREAVRHIWLSLFTIRNLWSFADDIAQIEMAGGTPEKLHLYDRTLHLTRRSRYGADDIELAHSMLEASDTPPLLKILLRDYFVDALGANDFLLSNALSDIAQSQETKGRLAAQAVSLCYALNGYDSALSLALDYKLATNSAYLPLERCLRPDSPGARLLDAGVNAGPVFENRVNNSKSFAVVGNGHIEGTGNGGRIDSRDTVIRFNDFRLLNAEAGQKTDILSTVLYNRETFNQPMLGQVTQGVMAMATPWTTKRNDWAPLASYSAQGRLVSFLPTEPLRSLTLRLGYRPSSGLIIVAMIYGLLGRFERGWAFGMPLLLNGTDHRRAQGGNSSDRHNWDGEYELFNLICEGRY